MNYTRRDKQLKRIVSKYPLEELAASYKRADGVAYRDFIRNEASAMTGDDLREYFFRQETTSLLRQMAGLISVMENYPEIRQRAREINAQATAWEKTTEYLEQRVKRTNREIFSRVIEKVSALLWEDLETEHRARFLRSIRSMTLRSLSSEAFASFLFYENSTIHTWEALPVRYLADGKRKTLHGEPVCISLKGKHLIDGIWNLNRVLASAAQSTEELSGLNMNALPEYFPGLDVVLVSTDNHHRLAELYMRNDSAEIPVTQFDDAILYEQYDTDGEHFFLKTDPDNEAFRMNVTSVQLAIAFKLKTMELGLY